MVEPVNSDRRQHVRVGKNLIVSYFLPSDPSRKFELSQLKNISRGGMCLVTTESFASGAELAVEFMTPYLSETAPLTGVVIGSTEKITDLLYETRIQFQNLNVQAAAFLEEMIHYFLFEEKNEE